MKLENRLFSKLSASLCLLQLGSQCLDLLLVSFLPLVGLLLRHLEGLEVVGHHPQLLFQLEDLCLANVCSLLGFLKI